MREEKPDIRDRRSEVGGQRSEVGGRRFEARAKGKTDGRGTIAALGGGTMKNLTSEIGDQRVGGQRSEVGGRRFEARAKGKTDGRGTIAALGRWTTKDWKSDVRCREKDRLELKFNRHFRGATRLTNKRFFPYHLFRKKTARLRFDIATFRDQSPLIF